MAGQSGCHIWPAMLTQSDFSNPTQIRQIGRGFVYTFKVDISMTLFYITKKNDQIQYHKWFQNFT